MKKEELAFLNQMVDSIEKATIKLEESYEDKEFEKFNQAKKLILNIQRRISEILK